MNVSRRAFTLALGVVPSVPGDASNAEGHQLHSTGEASQPAINSVPRPKLFDPHELATVAAVAEVIIPATDTPGAREAHVAEYLDLILSDSPESVRTLFCEGLWWTDGYCQRSAGAPFKDLSVADRLRIVSELYDSSDEKNQTGHIFVRSMKTWTAKIYYSTRIGEQELNKGGRVPATYFGHCAS